MSKHLSYQKCLDIYRIKNVCSWTATPIFYSMRKSLVFVVFTHRTKQQVFSVVFNSPNQEQQRQQNLLHDFTVRETRTTTLDIFVVNSTVSTNNSLSVSDAGLNI